MRVVLAGCGAMAAGWINAIFEDAELREEVEFAALVEPNKSRALEFSKKHGLANIEHFATLDSALNQVSADAVFDVTPPIARRSIVQAALESGLHVLSEKPMANSMADALALQHLAAKANRQFVITQNRRYSKSIRRIANFLRSGSIGEITGLHADFFLGPHFGGFREDMEHVLLLDMAIHTFDAGRYLADDNAKSVHCVEVNPTGSWYRHGASAFATFEMTQGALFTYRGSWCSEGAPTSWDSSWRITGTKGTVMWDGEDNIVAQVAEGPNAFFRNLIELEVPELENDKQFHGHASVIAEFLESVRLGRPSETGSSDNLHSIAMVFAAIESAKTGKTVNIQKLEFGS